MRLQLLLQNVKYFIHDAHHLTMRFTHVRPNSIDQARSLLQQCATTTTHNSSSSMTTTGNSLAYTLLKIDREIVFLRYKGLNQYIQDTSFWNQWKQKTTNLLNGPGRTQQQRNQSSNDSESEISSAPEGCNSQSNSTSESNSDSSDKVARVAFMITRQQRHILRTELDYTEQEIKSLKPIEALLIVENEISATAPATATATKIDDGDTNDPHWREIVSNLVKENEERQRATASTDDVNEESSLSSSSLEDEPISSEENVVNDMSNSTSTVHEDKLQLKTEETIETVTDIATTCGTPKNDDNSAAAALVILPEKKEKECADDKKKTLK